MATRTVQLFDPTAADAQKLAEKFHELQNAAERSLWEQGDILLALRKKKASIQDIAALLGFRYSKGYLSKLQSVAGAFKGGDRDAATSAGATVYDCYQAVRLSGRKFGKFPVPAPKQLLTLLLKGKSDPAIADPFESVAETLRKEAERWLKAVSKAPDVRSDAPDVFEGAEVESEYPNPYGNVPNTKAFRRWDRAVLNAKKAAIALPLGGFAMIVGFDRDRNVSHTYGYLHGVEGDEGLAATALMAQLSRMLPRVRTFGKAADEMVEPSSRKVFDQLAAAVAKIAAETVLAEQDAKV